MKEITPPKTFEELPAKLFEAWKSLGIELGDGHWQALEQAARDNQGFGPFFYGPIAEYVKRTVPVSQFPGWEAAIGKVIGDDARAVEKGNFLVAALSYFLDVPAMFKIPVLQQALVGNGYNYLSRSVPRNHEERENMVSLLPKLDAPEVQRVLLMRLASLYERNEDDCTEQELDELVKNALTSVPDEALMFPESWSEYNTDHPANRFCSRMRDHELLQQLMTRGNSPLRCAAIERYQSWARSDLRWDSMLDLVSKHPKDFAVARARWFDLDATRILWESGDPVCRAYAAEHAFALHDASRSRWGSEYITGTPQDYLDFIREMYNEDSALVVASYNRDDPDDRIRHKELNAIMGIWSLKFSEFNNGLLPLLAYRFKEDPFEGIREDVDEDEEEERDYDAPAILSEAQTQFVNELLVQQPDMLAKVKPAEIALLLTYLDTDEAARAVSPVIMPIAAKSKPMQQKVPVGFARVSPALLDELGWLDDKRKGVRTVGLESLLLNESKDAVPLLTRLYEDKKTSDADKERIANKIEALSGGTEGLAPVPELSVDDLIEKAAKAKIKPQIDKIWSGELAASFAPLDEQIGRWLLNMALESKEDTLPNSVASALQSLTRENQASLVEHLVQLWLANNGDSKMRWMMKFVPGFGDDRIVEPLFDGFKKWNKRAKPKAVFALETICSIDTTFALSQVHEVYGKNAYSYAIATGAHGALKAAAERRNVSLLDLFDELTPDFGLSAEGLVLDVGPHTYTVSVNPDLSLRIRNDKTEKVSKSLPKAKADEDADKRAAAASQFNLLRRNLKKTAKQQAKRLCEAMICERTWSAPRWKTLFFDHPLLGVLGQGFIWQTTSGLSFRISEDRSPINAQDETVEVDEDDSFRLWHPANATEEEAAAWAQHMQDYEITPLLDQLGQPRIDLTEEELESDGLKRYEGLEIEQIHVQRFMESWNYEVTDQDGSSVFGYYRSFPMAGIHVSFDVDNMSSFIYMDGETTKIGPFEFFEKEREKLKLNQVPRALLATIIGHGEVFKSKASTASE